MRRVVASAVVVPGFVRFAGPGAQGLELVAAWAQKCVDRLCGDVTVPTVGRVADGCFSGFEVHRVVQRFLFDERQDHHDPGACCHRPSRQAGT